MNPWEQIAYWLADCEAATAYHYERKSASKSERRRHISIMEDLLKMLKAGDLIGHQVRKPEDIQKRLEETIVTLRLRDGKRGQ